MGRFRKWLIYQLGGFTTDMDVYTAALTAIEAYLVLKEEHRLLQSECKELKKKLEEQKRAE